MNVLSKCSIHTRTHAHAERNVNSRCPRCLCQTSTLRSETHISIFRSPVLGSMNRKGHKIYLYTDHLGNSGQPDQMPGSTNLFIHPTFRHILDFGKAVLCDCGALPEYLHLYCSNKRARIVGYLGVPIVTIDLFLGL